jgi:hypothetical protein
MMNYIQSSNRSDICNGINYDLESTGGGRGTINIKLN